MAKYLLSEAAIIGGVLVEKGTEVGDGTPFPLGGIPPGPHMIPLTPDAHGELRRQAVNRPELDPALLNHPLERPGTPFRRPEPPKPAEPESRSFKPGGLDKPSNPKE